MFLLPLLDPPCDITLTLLHRIQLAIPGHCRNVISMRFDQFCDPLFFSRALLSRTLPLRLYFCFLRCLSLKLRHDIVWIPDRLEFSLLIRQIIQRVVQGVAVRFISVGLYYTENSTSFGISLNLHFLRFCRCLQVTRCDCQAIALSRYGFAHTSTFDLLGAGYARVQLGRES